MVSADDHRDKARVTYWTAGTRAGNGTIANPSVRIAADCISAASSRVPTGMLSIVLVHQEMPTPTSRQRVSYSLLMSRIKKAAKSMELVNQRWPEDDDHTGLT